MFFAGDMRFIPFLSRDKAFDRLNMCLIRRHIIHCCTPWAYVETSVIFCVDLRLWIRANRSLIRFNILLVAICGGIVSCSSSFCFDLTGCCIMLFSVFFVAVSTWNVSVDSRFWRNVSMDRSFMLYLLRTKVELFVGNWADLNWSCRSKLGISFNLVIICDPHFLSLFFFTFLQRLHTVVDSNSSLFIRQG